MYDFVFTFFVINFPTIFWLPIALFYINNIFVNIVKFQQNYLPGDISYVGRLFQKKIIFYFVNGKYKHAFVDIIYIDLFEFCISVCLFFTWLAQGKNNNSGFVVFYLYIYAAFCMCSKCHIYYTWQHCPMWVCASVQFFLEGLVILIKTNVDV